VLKPEISIIRIATKICFNIFMRSVLLLGANLIKK